MLKLFERCPSCGGQIVVTECRCANCQLQMRGEFRQGVFSTLSEDQLTFVQVFLRARGNLTEVEKVLGISYPTIRNKLEEINSTLDRTAPVPSTDAQMPQGPSEPTPAPKEDARRAVLQAVAAGQLSAADAALKLRQMQGGN